MVGLRVGPWYVTQPAVDRVGKVMERSAFQDMHHELRILLSSIIRSEGLHVVPARDAEDRLVLTGSLEAEQDVLQQLRTG